MNVAPTVQEIDLTHGKRRSLFISRSWLQQS
jgi:hypothetical protein